MLIIAPGQVAQWGYLFDFNMKVCCVFSLEPPHRGDSDEYTTYHFQYEKEKKNNYPKSVAVEFFQVTKD